MPLRWEDLDPSVEPTLEFDALQAALARQPRVLLFSHPNNPTGAVFPPSVIQRIAELVRETDVIVVADELYSTARLRRATFRTSHRRGRYEGSLHHAARPIQD